MPETVRVTVLIRVGLKFRFRFRFRVRFRVRVRLTKGGIQLPTLLTRNLTLQQNI